MKVNSLAAVIELLAVYHPLGVRILQGQASPLSSDDWENLVDSIYQSEKVHVQTHNTPEDRVLSQIEKRDAIPGMITEIGGWDVVLSAVNAFRSCYPREWRSFIRYCMIKTAPCAFETVEDLAKKIHMSRTTLWRMRHKIPQYLAHMIVSGKIDIPPFAGNYN